MYAISEGLKVSEHLLHISAFSRGLPYREQVDCRPPLIVLCV